MNSFSATTTDASEPPDHTTPSTGCCIDRLRPPPFPDVFSVGGPRRWLQVMAVVLFAVGVVVWAWSVVSILTKVRDGELVTSGPYALVKHPLFTRLLC